MEMGVDQLVRIPADSISLEGSLTVPANPESLVIFAHGSGSSRFSARNRFVAEELNKNRIATLLFDLLTAEEDIFYENRFDIDLLASRLKAATLWAREQDIIGGLPTGYFGASTGAASALKASVSPGLDISAIVSRGGRPDLAKEALPSVKAPTLLIVGGLDELVIELNREAFRLLECEKELKIIPGATHLFQEPGALEAVARLASGWFHVHLAGRARTA